MKKLIMGLLTLLSIVITMSFGSSEQERQSVISIAETELLFERVERVKEAKKLGKMLRAYSGAADADRMKKRNRNRLPKITDADYDFLADSYFREMCFGRIRQGEIAEKAIGFESDRHLETLIAFERLSNMTHLLNFFRVRTEDEKGKQKFALLLNNLYALNTYAVKFLIEKGNISFVDITTSWEDLEKRLNSKEISKFIKIVEEMDNDFRSREKLKRPYTIMTNFGRK